VTTNSNRADLRHPTIVSVPLARGIERLLDGRQVADRPNVLRAAGEAAHGHRSPRLDAVWRRAAPLLATMPIR
jgi:hypothetical protein